MDSLEANLFKGRYIITLLIVAFILFINADILKGEMSLHIDKESNFNSMERFTAFIDGTVEQIGMGTITVEGTEYVFSPETTFMTTGNPFLSEDNIHLGDPVRIIFIPTENNMALKIELQERDDDIVTNNPWVAPSPAAKRNDNVILKNGVYINELTE